MVSKVRLGLFDFSMIVIGLVIGMGIFGTTKTAANAALTPTIYFAAWIVGGLIAICGALTYAEIGSRYPVTGGYYKVFSYAYHPSVAFALNGSILISNAASVSGVALIGAGYISSVFFPDATDTVKVIIAISSILIFYGVNLMGLRMSAKAQSVLMLLKIGMLLLVVSALFFPSIHYNGPTIAATTDSGWMDTISSLGLCLVAVSFTYGGYQQTINFGNEVKDASKTIPRAIFIGIIVIISLYLAVNFAYYKVIGFDNMRSSSEIASLVVGKLFGPTGASVFSALLFLSVLAYVNVSLMSNPRVMYAMSEDGMLPRIFQKKNDMKDVLTIALSAFASICIIVLFFAKTFDKILSFSIFLDSFGMAASAATIFRLRKKTAHLDNTGIYKMKLFPLLPVIFILAYIFVCSNIIRTNPQTAMVGTIVMISFVILYFLIKRFTDKQSSASS